MSEKDPKKLDELFQQGSEQYDFEYNPEAWEQMESLMDRDKRRRRIWWWWWGGLLFLLLTGSIWLFTIKEKKHTPGQIALEKTAAPQTENKSGKPETGSLLPKDSSNLSAQNSLDSSLNKQKADLQAVEPDKKTIHKLSPVIDPDLPQERPHAVKANGAEPTEPIATPKEVLINSEKAGNEGDPSLPIRDSLRQFEQNLVLESTALAKLPVLPFSTLSYQKGQLTKSKLPAITFEEKAPAIKPGKQNFLLIGLLGAAEMNVVDTDHRTGLDWKGGIQLEYFYQGRYSISLGANYVQKSYEAGAGAYAAPKGFWTREIAPQSTEGMCKILETPLLIGYYPRGILRSGLFAKIGFTSFFMLKERYYFYYDRPDADLVRKWYGKNEYRHWFGIGQISMGYHWSLGDKISVQAAPYFQIPLTGLGHGNMKLWSIGLNANFNFRVN